MRGHANIAGQRFGRLVAGETIKTGSRWYVEVRCDCGTSKRILFQNWGQTASCGCLIGEANSRRSTTHGESRRTPEYVVWNKIKQRCGNPNNSHYSYYGGRGISVCQEWQNSYETFLDYVGRRPSPEHELDRYPNNNGNYEPGNVRWATKTEQMNNERRTIAEWSRAVGVPFARISTRLKRGWSIERTLTTPVQ